MLCASVAMHLATKVRRKQSISKNESWNDVLHSDRVHFISLYRAFMMVLTCICILAVDFRIFPRAFAKTETYGQSVMDVGVGCFVFASALVSKQAQSYRHNEGYMHTLKSTVVKVSPLLVLGLIRLFATKSADYQEHVSEYGVHWNFFFTLAGVALLVAVLSPRREWSAITGLLLVAAYQFALSFLGI